ncbi:MAG: class I SAM-dependent RNA methyltransferase [Blastocatellia bacterium]
MSIAAVPPSISPQPRTGVTPGELHEATIEKIVFGGDGLARIGAHAVFIPQAAPGDFARIRITALERNFARGVIEEILVPSPWRREPLCRHFGDCGGCQLQHLDYRAQLDIKVEFVRESLRRLGQIEWNDTIPVRAAGEIAYRSRAEIKVARDAAGRTQLGYYRAGTHDICEVAHCPILSPGPDRVLQQLAAEPQLIPANATRVFLTAGDDEVIFTPGTGENGRAAELDALGTARQRIRDISYEFGVRSFFQANRLLVDDLVGAAVDGHSGALAVDLYAGVGLFSLQLARTFDQVIAVEGNRPAAAHAQNNTRLNGVANVTHETMSVEAWLKYKTAGLARPDLVLLDPPRTGAGPQVISRIAALAPARIAYVSCDPSTLARDLKSLLPHGWRIESITALDMFPQTFHVETVVHLKKSEE